MNISGVEMRYAHMLRSHVNIPAERVIQSVPQNNVDVICQTSCLKS